LEIKCQICRENEAEQKHHVSYYPDEMTIDICIACHKRLHKHPVGTSRRTNIEVVTDGPPNSRIPLSHAKLYLKYLCVECNEDYLISQSLINLLLFKKSLAEPRMKCPLCKGTSYVFQLENSYISSDQGSFSITGEIKSTTEKEEEIDIDILYTGKPRSLQMQLQAVLGVIGERERIEGMVSDDDIYEALSSDHGIGRTEGARLIGVLMRDGTIYSPRPGGYKRTP